MMKRLVGMGKNRSFGGGKGHKRPKMSKGKAAPPEFAVLEEENEVKKRKIKVKIVQKVDEKRKKKRKKRRKSAKKRRNRGSLWPYIGGYTQDFGGDGGDGGGGE